ncbi:hypothetical protein SAMN05444158_1713 [Bradyrhizobium canariense]|uniref:Uncharacterized protein n=1 Tax=Bradyrhizobium canariense TaxID=255045 RepID=A0A1H1RAE1_9BRAD|nr:hypothetical protein SAMN05444158_1713 [Bradyrhizobium canariense]
MIQHLRILALMRGGHCRILRFAGFGGGFNAGG